MSAPCSKCGEVVPQGVFCKDMVCPLRDAMVSAQPVAEELPPLAKRLADIRKGLHPNFWPVLAEAVEAFKAQPVQQPAAVGDCRMYCQREADEVATFKGVVKEAVNRFLGWQLPHNFSPDNGIEFYRPEDRKFWPIGTNLFTADEAKAMFEHCITVVPAAGVQGDGVLPEDFRPNKWEGSTAKDKAAIAWLRKEAQHWHDKTVQPDSGHDAALVDYGYQQLFDAIAAATKIEGGWVSISVAAFRSALAAHPAPSSYAAIKGALQNAILDLGPPHKDERFKDGFDSCRYAASEVVGNFKFPAAAHPANGAQADLVAKINALRVRGVNYEDGVPARQLVDRAEVLALLGGAA